MFYAAIIAALLALTVGISLLAVLVVTFRKLAEILFHLLGKILR